MNALVIALPAIWVGTQAISAGLRPSIRGRRRMRKPRRFWTCFYCLTKSSERHSECVGCLRVRREAA